MRASRRFCARARASARTGDGVSALPAASASTEKPPVGACRGSGRAPPRSPARQRSRLRLQIGDEHCPVVQRQRQRQPPGSGPGEHPVQQGRQEAQLHVHQPRVELADMPVRRFREQVAGQRDEAERRHAGSTAPNPPHGRSEPGVRAANDRSRDSARRQTDAVRQPAESGCGRPRRRGRRFPGAGRRSRPARATCAEGSA